MEAMTDRHAQELRDALVRIIVAWDNPHLNVTQQAIDEARTLLDAAPQELPRRMKDPTEPPFEAVRQWFHDSEEICEHDLPGDARCEIMRDHLLRDFDVQEKGAAPQETLDVERLALALRAETDGGVSLYDLWSTGNYSFESPREVAELLAAEYARLATAPEAAPDEWQQRIDRMSDEEFNRFAHRLDEVAAAKVQKIRDEAAPEAAGEDLYDYMAEEHRRQALAADPEELMDDARLYAQQQEEGL